MATQNNTTAWADLPNAKYIDMIMYSLKKDNAARDAAYNAARDAVSDAAWVAAMDAAYNEAKGAAYKAARDAARDAAWGAAWDAAWGSAYNAAWGAAWGAAWDAVRDAVRALIAWDDCGYLLDEKPEDVKKLALLGNQAAVLLYPACIALNKSKELENSSIFA